MDRQYDIFEILADGVPVWREAIHGKDNALRKSAILAAKTPNEIRVMHVPTKTTIATMNNQAKTQNSDGCIET